MMLDHRGESDPARRVMAAIEQVTADPALHARDLGGRATTADVTAAGYVLLAEGAPRKTA